MVSPTLHHSWEVGASNTSGPLATGLASNQFLHQGTPFFHQGRWDSFAIRLLFLSHSSSSNPSFTSYGPWEAIHSQRQHLSCSQWALVGGMGHHLCWHIIKIIALAIPLGFSSVEGTLVAPARPCRVEEWLCQVRGIQSLDRRQTKKL